MYLCTYVPEDFCNLLLYVIKAAVLITYYALFSHFIKYFLNYL